MGIETEEVVVNAHSLLTKLCNVEQFTEDNQRLVDQLQQELKSASQSLSVDVENSSKHYAKIMHTQGRIAELMANDGKIRYRRMGNCTTHGYDAA